MFAVLVRIFWALFPIGSLNSLFLLVLCSSFNVFFKIVERLFENRGETVKFENLFAVVDYGVLVQRNFLKISFLKWYWRVLNYNLEDISHNYYFSHIFAIFAYIVIIIRSAQQRLILLVEKPVEFLFRPRSNLFCQQNFIYLVTFE